ncbi:LL-diaminopimelate aminotransferase [Elusimicrobium simillimum]|uniref:LL-diaminopimelate aminotransferase n=1 Tax=Elusimicrobium simillimum TaxID=3143438 RepID=UPI003C6ED1FE
MTKLNENYQKLENNYLFAAITKKVEEFKAANPQADIIRLGIGDVTLPLPHACIEAMKRAADDMGRMETFQGYGPYEGYDFLRNKIAQFDYKERGVNIEADEIFVSDGAKSDTANFQELFSIKNTIAITDPVYPVYLDSNVIAGRTGIAKNGKYGKVIYMPCTAKNNFSPDLPKKHADIIYLCSPNNPTGTALSKDALTAWVNYAIEHKSVIMYDSAYEAFIQDPSVPRSIYEIEGAKKVVVEFRSFSKTAGFTGTRCAYTVIPKELVVEVEDGSKKDLNSMWLRRQATKFNGVPYIIQRGAEAVYSEEGQKEVKANIAYYLENAKIIRDGVSKIKGIKAYGGVNAPYIWLKLPKGVTSWQFFDMLLDKAHVVGTPGSGFGPHGEGYFRLTAFNTRERTLEAVERIKNMTL